MSDARPVYIYNEYRALPTFHLPSLTTPEVERTELSDGWVNHHWEFRTYCGELIGTTAWQREADSTRSRSCVDADYGLRLRRDHAEKFARLCRTCERNQARKAERT